MTLTPEQIPARWSMTHLSHADNCLHSLYLLLKFGSGTSHPMARGSAIHIFAERLLWELIGREEPNLYAAAENEDPMHAKAQVASLTEAMVDEILRSEPRLHMPQSEADRVREMAYHIAVGWRVDPQQVVAVEQKFVFDLGGKQVVGKVDVLVNEDGLLHVRDLKTSWVVPAREEFEQGFQLRLYAAAVMFGRPAQKNLCLACEGIGDFPEPTMGQFTAANVNRAPCGACSGRGYTETLGEPLGRDAARVKVSEDYPRYLNAEGEVRSQSVEITRTEAHDFLVDLARLVDRVEQAIEEDKFPAVPGSHCGICPAWTECPIAEPIRAAAFDPDGQRQKEQGGIASAEEAEEVARRWQFARAFYTAEAKRLRPWIKEHGPVPFGDEEIALDVQTSRETDHEALAEAALSGQPFDLATFRKERTSTVMKKRKRKDAA